MSTSQGQFVWCELMTDDPAAATAFYRSVIGWDAKDSGMPGVKYTLLSAGGTDVAGVMELPEQARAAGARPGWTGYVAVDDVDAVAARIKAAGGAIHRAPDDIPGVGRFAVAGDPHGALFNPFQPKGTREAPPEPNTTPGHMGWHELHAGDWEKAFAFYSGLFGWTKAEALDMGPMGVYQLFAAGGAPIGGMMTKTDAIPRPMWLHYFNVDDIDAAVARLKGAGGRLLHGPLEVPGGSWIAQCADPEGVMFAMVSPGR